MHPLDDPARLAAVRACGMLDLEVDAALYRVVSVARRVLGADASAITLLDDDTAWVKAYAGVDRVEPFTLPTCETGCQHVFSGPDDGPLSVPDARGLIAWRRLPSVRDGRVVAYLGAPLTTRDGYALGVLCAIEPRPRDWTADEAALLTDLAGLAMQTVERRTAELLAHQRAGEAWAAEARYRAVAEHMPDCLVMLVDRDMRFVVASGSSEMAAIGMCELDFIGRTVAEVAAPHNRETQVAMYTRALGGEKTDSRGHRNNRQMRITAVPVRDASGAITHAMALAQDITDLMRAEAEARELSLRDPLTGLYNRRGLSELAGQIIKQADRSKRGALVFFCDINGMKNINDTHGHDAGDEAIRALAGLLRLTFRDADILARTGGDEFVAVCPDVAPDIIGSFRERLWRNVQAYNAASDEPWRLSVSTGASVYDPRQPCSLDEVMKRADAALYGEKARRKTTGLSSGNLAAVRKP